MADDVIVAKAAIIERCVKRAREELAASPDFAQDFTRQDAAILNVERACDASVDMANRILRLSALGVPTSSRDSFALLRQANIIEDDMRDRLARMVGFRNLAVHQYEKLDIAIVRAVIATGLDDLLAFSTLALRLP